MILNVCKYMIILYLIFNLNKDFLWLNFICFFNMSLKIILLIIGNYIVFMFVYVLFLF